MARSCTNFFGVDPDGWCPKCKQFHNQKKVPLSSKRKREIESLVKKVYGFDVKVFNGRVVQVDGEGKIVVKKVIVTPRRSAIRIGG